MGLFVAPAKSGQCNNGALRRERKHTRAADIFFHFSLGAAAVFTSEFPYKGNKSRQMSAAFSEGWMEGGREKGIASPMSGDGSGGNAENRGKSEVGRKIGY